MDLAKNKTLKYLIDIGHPAHVHYFKNFAVAAMGRGHQVLFTCRDKDVAVMLLKHLKFKFINLGKPFKSVVGKIFGLFYFSLRILWISVSYKPDMYLNGTVYSAFVAWLIRKPHLALEDTFNMEQVKMYRPFTSCILTGSYKHPDLGKKEIRYNGYQELLYLHPQYFTPDIEVFQELGLSRFAPYVIVRFVSWSASHDIGHKGISKENKYAVVEEFSKYARVFISSEAQLPGDLEVHRIRIAPHRMHDALAFSQLVFGESSTMVSEAAMLGVPGVFLDNTGRYYTRDQQDRFGLVFNYSESEDDQINAIERGVEILRNKGAKKEWESKRAVLLAECIICSDF
jgi:uncharacterized protein